MHTSPTAQTAAIFALSAPPRAFPAFFMLSLRITGGIASVMAQQQNPPTYPSTVPKLGTTHASAAALSTNARESRGFRRRVRRPQRPSQMTRHAARHEREGEEEVDAEQGLDRDAGGSREHGDDDGLHPRSEPEGADEAEARGDERAQVKRLAHGGDEILGPPHALLNREQREVDEEQERDGAEETGEGGGVGERDRGRLERAGGERDDRDPDHAERDARRAHERDEVDAA